MGCDFFYDGCLPDIKLQEKVIRFFLTYNSSEMLIHPKSEKKYLTKHVSVRKDYLNSYKLYPFNFYGIIPDHDDTLFVQDQFIFDRSAHGKLVRFLKLPESFKLSPHNKFYLNC